MICQICQAIFTKIGGKGTLPVYGTWQHHSDFTSFMDSVNDGCYICNSVWVSLHSPERLYVLAALEDEGNSDNSSQSQRVSHHGFCRPIDKSECVTSFRWWPKREAPTDNGLYSFSLRMLLVRWDPVWFKVTSPQNISGPQIASELASSTKSSESFLLAAKWIEECGATHDSCSIAHPNSWYPTRLIDCGLSTGADTCRLVEPGLNSVNGPYITLSHCWGQTDCLKLTTDNYDQLLTYITLSLLPQLYQDAVYAVRQLGVRYLWIDSLCIIQKGDELKDWQREVTLMSEVYSHAFCNISAAVAPNSEHSMFNSRRLETIIPHTIRPLNDSNEEIEQCVISNPGIWVQDVERATINTRAWVVQERLFSRRNLYFGESQMAWECCEKQACEIYPAGLPDYINSDKLKNKVNLRKQSKTRGHDSEALTTWVSIVMTYTSCNLSFPSDKLPAISSTAQRMKAAVNDQYVVGMWRRTLFKELLWSVHDDYIRQVRRQEYRAPSWSWAAVDGPIGYIFRDDERAEVLINIEDLQIEYLTNDDTQQVTGGFLKLRGKLRPMQLLDTSTTLPENTGFILQLKGRGTWGNVSLDTLHEDFHDENDRGTLYYMPVMNLGKEGGSFVQSLLLEKDPVERGVFRRIGVSRHRFEEEAWRRLLGVEEGEEQFPCVEYRDGFHYIVIK